MQNKILENVFRLDHEVAFTIPSTKNFTELITPLEYDQRINEIGGIMAEMFGGASSQKQKGFYKFTSGTLTGTIGHEDSTRMVSGTVDIESHLVEFYNLAKTKVVEWGQESILLELDGVKYFIEQ